MYQRTDRWVKINEYVLKILKLPKNNITIGIEDSVEVLPDMFYSKDFETLRDSVRKIKQKARSKCFHSFLFPFCSLLLLSLLLVSCFFLPFCFYFSFLFSLVLHSFPFSFHLPWLFSLICSFLSFPFLSSSHCFFILPLLVFSLLILSFPIPLFQWQSKPDNWRKGTYSCSAQLISFEINCFDGL